jgi:dipeptidyl aminopeptidase/acylaminoacyl peptidase
VKELKFVDRSKVGVVGEGLGGYTAGMVMAEDLESSQPLTKCALLISPVVDWRSYGTPFLYHLAQSLGLLFRDGAPYWY